MYRIFKALFCFVLLFAQNFCISHIYAVNIIDFPIPTVTSEPIGITEDRDGNLWFTESNSNKIGQITLMGVLTEFSIPTPNSAPYGITACPDGSLWFTESNSNKIGQITPTGVITEYPIPTANSLPIDITTGPDGNLWFTEELGNKIGKITPTGVITEFPIPTANSDPFGIKAGPDGNLWFTEFRGNKIGRITPTGVITEFSIPTANSLPIGITTGPDDNLWFTEFGSNNIGKITPTGVITEFPIPTENSAPFGITAGPDGNLWFTEEFTNQIGMITPTGVITEFPIPTANSLPFGITAGTAGTMWFTELSGNSIGRISQISALTTTMLKVIPNSAMGNQAVTLIANVAPTGATGTVEFFNGEASIGVAVLSGGQAELIVNSFVVGTHSPTAVYNGNINFARSTSPATFLIVNSISTTTTLSVNPNSAMGNQAVTLIANVAPTGATGTVEFFNGEASIGVAVLSGGKAELIVNSFAAGTHSLTAVYSGNNAFISSTSQPVILTVNLVSTTTKLTVSPNPVKRNQTVTLTAIVSPPSATGSVSFYSNNQLLGVSLVANGQATLVTNFSQRGEQLIAATYSKDNQFLGSVSNVVTLNVGKLASIPPPRKLTGFKRRERFKIASILKWKAPKHSSTIVAYKIYRGSLNHQIGTVTNLQHLRFKDLHIQASETYTYFVVSVDKFGNTSKPAKVVIRDFAD